MDENEYMIGIAESSQVVFSKYQKPVLVNLAKNQEWVSFIEAISTIAQQLLLFVILKSKK